VLLVDSWEQGGNFSRRQRWRTSVWAAENGRPGEHYVCDRQTGLVRRVVALQIGKAALYRRNGGRFLAMLSFPGIQQVLQAGEGCDTG
jgi:hypothetical protein